MTGNAIKFARDGSYRWVAVSEDGAINWFDHTSLGETTDYTSTTYWATDFEIKEVTYAGLDEYGTWDSPTHYDFPVKFARSDDGKAVVTAENYNYYTTLKLPFASILPDGVTAYEITGPTNKENVEVGLKELTLTDNILPYETPVLLSMVGGKGSTYPASKTIYLQPAKHHDIVTTGFNGTLGQKTFTDYDPSTNANYFILGKKNGRVAFYYLNNTVLAANKGVMTCLHAMTHVWNKRLPQQNTHRSELGLDTTNVCPKRAPWVTPMAHMFKGERLGTYPTVFDTSVLRQGSGASKSYAVGPLRGPAVCVRKLRI